MKTDLSDSIDTAPSEVENMPTQTINEVITLPYIPNYYCTEGEIKYIPFIAYLDAPKTPGVSKDVPLSTKLGFGSLVL